MVGVLKVVHEEGDEAAAQHQPQADEEEAHEPGVSAGLVGDIGHDLLLAGGAGRHPGVKAQSCVVAHKLLTLTSLRGRRVQPSCVNWHRCRAALWGGEGGVHVVNLDSIIPTVHRHHVGRSVLPSICTHCALLLCCLCSVQSRIGVLLLLM